MDFFWAVVVLILISRVRLIKLGPIQIEFGLRHLPNRVADSLSHAAKRLMRQ